MTDPGGLRTTRAYEGPLTPEATSEPPYAVTMTCGSCGRSARPKLDRWHYGVSWLDDWTVVFRQRTLRCKCGGAASGLLVTRAEHGQTETLLTIERSSPGSYAQLSGR